MIAGMWTDPLKSANSKLTTQLFIYTAKIKLVQVFKKIGLTSMLLKLSTAWLAFKNFSSISLSPIRTHTHTLSLSLSLSHTHFLSHCPTHPNPHSLTLSLSLSHTHFISHYLTHSLSLSVKRMTIATEENQEKKLFGFFFRISISASYRFFLLLRSIPSFASPWKTFSSKQKISAILLKVLSAAFLLLNSLSDGAR